MNPEVIKRTGEKEPFDVNKIKESVKKASEQAGVENPEELANEVLNEIIEEFQNKVEVSSEEIKNKIFESLEKKGYTNVIEAWEEYERQKGGKES